MSTEPMSFLQFALIAILVMMGLIYSRLGGILDALKGGGSAAKAAAPTSAPAIARGKTIHPGLSDEQFIAIISAAAAHTFGQSVSVVKFKPLNTMDWTWAVQGRVALHKNKV